MQINELYAIIAEKKNYLADTDYKVVKAMERGESLDESVKAEREDARRVINECEKLIKEVEEEMAQLHCE